MRKFYLGFDGAYVVSTRPLKVLRDENTHFLAPDAPMVMSELRQEDGDLLFGWLGLRRYEVVEVVEEAPGKLRVGSRQLLIEPAE